MGKEDMQKWRPSCLKSTAKEDDQEKLKGGTAETAAKTTKRTQLKDDRENGEDVREDAVEENLGTKSIFSALHPECGVGSKSIPLHNELAVEGLAAEVKQQQMLPAVEGSAAVAPSLG